MTVAFFSPAAQRRSLHNDYFAGAFDDLVRGFFVRPVSAAPVASTRGFKFDVREEGNQYLVEADLPGLKKDAIKIEIDGARVSISADYKTGCAPASSAAGTPGAAALDSTPEAAREATQRAAQDAARMVYSERRSGSVARSFELPAEIDQATASAKYEDGVLKLTLPKKVAESRKLLSIH